MRTGLEPVNSTVTGWHDKPTSPTHHSEEIKLTQNELQTHSSTPFRTPRSNVSSQVSDPGWISGWFYLSQRICTFMKWPLLFREVSLFHTSLVNWHWISWFGLSVDPNHRLYSLPFQDKSQSPEIYTHQHCYWWSGYRWIYGVSTKTTIVTTLHYIVMFKPKTPAGLEGCLLLHCPYLRYSYFTLGDP